MLLQGFLEAVIATLDKHEWTRGASPNTSVIARVPDSELIEHLSSFYFTFSPSNVVRRKLAGALVFFCMLPVKYLHFLKEYGHKHK